MITANARPEELTQSDFIGLVRAEVVPFYVRMLVGGCAPDQIARINKLIINRWSVAGLIYIKEQAWKMYDPDGSKFRGETID
jgi:hypothetical protein